MHPKAPGYAQVWKKQCQTHEYLSSNDSPATLGLVLNWGICRVAQGLPSICRISSMGGR